MGGGGGGDNLKNLKPVAMLCSHNVTPHARYQTSYRVKLYAPLRTQMLQSKEGIGVRWWKGPTSRMSHRDWHKASSVRTTLSRDR